MTTSFTNVFKNLVAPITRNSNTAMGFGIDVVLETLISWAIRYLIGLQHGFFEILITVTLAAPLIGIGSFMEDPQLQMIKDNKTLQTSEWSTRFLIGLQTCPSILLSQYVVGTFQKGNLYLPKFRIWDFLVTIMARTMSRVIILYANEKDWAGMKYWREYQQLQRDQIAGGTFSKDPTVQPARGGGRPGR